MANGIYALALESGYVPEQTRLLRSKIRPVRGTSVLTARALPPYYNASKLPPEIMEDLPPRLAEDIEDEFGTEGKNPKLAQKIKQEWIAGLEKGELNPFTTPTTVLWRRPEEERTSGEYNEEDVLKHENLHHFYNQASSLLKNIEGRSPRISEEEVTEIRNLVPGHNTEEALIRRQGIINQADPDLQKELLWQAYANTTHPILTDDILEDPVKLRETAKYLYDEGGRDKFFEKDVTEEEALDSIIKKAQRAAHILRRYESGFPRLIELMNEHGVPKFAEGGFVQTGPKLTGEPTAQALAGGLATLGRYGDDYMVHAAEGETIIPAEVLQANPGLKNDIFRQMQAMGIEEPSRYVVGSEFNSINPITGQPEFFFKKIFKAIKKILPMALPIVGNLIAPGIGGIVGSALGTAISGGDASDILKNVLWAGGTQALMGGLGSIGKSGQSFFGGAKQAIGNIFSSPTAAFQKGIFGGIPGASSVSNPVSKSGPGAQVTDLSRPASIRVAEGSGAKYNYPPGWQPGEPYKTSFDLAPVDDLNLYSSATPEGGGWLGSNKLLLAGGAGLAGLAVAGAFDEDENGESEAVVSGDPQVAAYDKWLKIPPSKRDTEYARALLREAGVVSAFTRPRLSGVAGISPQKTREYLSSSYNVADGGAINGPGTGISDSIPALLSDGEFVMTADAVRGAGGGNRQQGAARMYDMMQQFERVA